MGLFLMEHACFPPLFHVEFYRFCQGSRDCSSDYCRGLDRQVSCRRRSCFGSIGQLRNQSESSLHPSPFTLSSLIFLTRLHLEFSCSPFQTCGCNGTVDEDVAQDLDAIVDSLDDLQEDFKKVGFFPSRMYALVFRLRKLFLTFFASL